MESMTAIRRRLWLPVAVMATVAAVGAGAAPGASAEVTQVAGPCDGSSNPTIYANSRRVAVTPGRRVLAIFDPHGRGQQLKWRDPGGPWRSETRGAVSNGSFPEDAPGDRTGTIAVTPRQAGARIVWSGTNAVEYPVPVRMARLTGLDAPGGPRVAEVTSIAGVGRGKARPDVAFERGPRGRLRGVVTWLARGPDSFHVVAGWFDPAAPGPLRVHHRTTVLSAPDGSATQALVPTPAGMRIVTTTGRGTLRMFRHRGGAPLRRWRAGRAVVAAPRDARPSAVWATGRVMVAVGGASGPVRVVAFSATGRRARVVKRMAGRSEPVITGGGRRAWVVMVRSAGGELVSRRFVRGSGWSKRERVEAGGDLSEPNAPRHTRRRLRVLVQGDRCASNAKSNEVLLAERRLRRR
jgi:hypothetical protein